MTGLLLRPLRLLGKQFRRLGAALAHLAARALRVAKLAAVAGAILVILDAILNESGVEEHPGEP